MKLELNVHISHMEAVLKNNFNLTPEEREVVRKTWQQTPDDFYGIAKLILMIEQKAEYISIPAIMRTRKMIAMELMQAIYKF